MFPLKVDVNCKGKFFHLFLRFVLKDKNVPNSPYYYFSQHILTESLLCDRYCAKHWGHLST